MVGRELPNLRPMGEDHRGAVGGGMEAPPGKGTMHGLVVAVPAAIEWRSWEATLTTRVLWSLMSGALGFLHLRGVLPAINFVLQV